MDGRLAGFSAARDRELRVFLPLLHERVARAVASGQRFVHYTGAPAAMSMIRNGEMWLRNTQCMNDFSEVRYGLELLDAAYRSDDGQRLIGFLEEVHPALRGEVRERIAELAETVAYGTYIGCVSEHDPGEDGIGRLSMWRAYSGMSGIALVLRNPPLIGPGSDRLGVFTGPVVYDGRQAFMQRFGHFVAGMLREGDYLAGLDAAHAGALLVGSYHFAALATKHPGFAEEREWRMVFTPSQQSGGDLVRSVEILPRRAAARLQAATAGASRRGRGEHRARRRAGGADHRPLRIAAGAARRLHRPAGGGGGRVAGDGRSGFGHPDPLRGGVVRPRHSFWPSSP